MLKAIQEDKRGIRRMEKKTIENSVSGDVGRSRNNWRLFNWVKQKRK